MTSCAAAPQDLRCTRAALSEGSLRAGSPPASATASAGPSWPGASHSRPNGGLHRQECTEAARQCARCTILSLQTSGPRTTTIPYTHGTCWCSYAQQQPPLGTTPAGHPLRCRTSAPPALGLQGPVAQSPGMASVSQPKSAGILHNTPLRRAEGALHYFTLLTCTQLMATVASQRSPDRNPLRPPSARHSSLLQAAPYRRAAPSLPAMVIVRQLHPARTSRQPPPATRAPTCCAVLPLHPCKRRQQPSKHTRRLVLLAPSVAGA
jgi:hypothetical protein